MNEENTTTAVKPQMAEQNFQIGDYLAVTSFAKYIDFEEVDIDWCPFVVSLVSPFNPNRVFFLSDLLMAKKLCAADVPADIRNVLDQSEQERRKRIEKIEKEEERAALIAFGIAEDDGETQAPSSNQELHDPSIDDEIF